MIRKVIYISTVVVFCLLKGLVLVNFSFDFTDHDQCTLWHAAVEASHGDFHEPCFYGQDYNSNTEAYFSVPLLWLQVPVYLALPIVTSIMCSLVFLLTSLAFYIKKSWIAAVIMLLVPVLLPAEYHLISSMPRGFVPGLFLVSVGHFIHEWSGRNWSVWFMFLLMSLALWINPNSIIMSIPVALKFTLDANIRAYVIAFAGGLVGSCFKIFTWRFYEEHPLYAYHMKPMFGFDKSLLWNGLLHLDGFFFNGTWLLLLLLGMALLVNVATRRYAWLVITGIFVVFFVATLGMERVHDGRPTIFYHQGRMFLGVSWTIAFFLAMALKDGVVVNQMRRTKLLAWSGVLLLWTMFFFKWEEVNVVIKRETSLDDKGVVVSDVETLLRRNNAVINSCTEHGVDLVVFPYRCMNCWLDTYSIPALSDGQIETINISEDRRGWRFEEELKRSSRSFYAMGCGEASTNFNASADTDPLDNQWITGCYFTMIDTNVVDFYRPRLANVRFGY